MPLFFAKESLNLPHYSSQSPKILIVRLLPAYSLDIIQNNTFINNQKISQYKQHTQIKDNKYSKYWYQERKMYKLPLPPPTATNNPSLPLITHVNCFSSGNLSFVDRVKSLK